MILSLIFSSVSFLLFMYVLMYKFIKKNDMLYLYILGFQVLGILINVIQISSDGLGNSLWTAISFVLCIALPLAVVLMEYKGINLVEVVYIAIAKVLSLIGNDKKTKNVLLSLLSKYDGSYWGHKMLAEIYEKEGGMRKAIDEYVKVLDIKKNDEQSYFKISALLNDLGRKNEAVEMLKTLHKKRPELYSATQMLGELLLEQEKFRDALEVYMNAVRFHPDNFEIYYNLGIIHTRLNNFDLAKEYYEKAAELNHDFVNSYYRMGQIALLYRDIDQAENSFINSLGGQTEAMASMELAKIYALKNEPLKAAKFANRAVELEPDMYKQVQKEPLLFVVKKDVVPPKESDALKSVVLSHKEQMVNEYLKDTYNLTKHINLQEAQESGINISKFKWERGTEQKQRIN